MKRLPYKKRHIAPSIIAAGISTAVPLVTSLLQNGNKDAINARKDMLGNMLKQKATEDEVILDNYDVNGVNGFNYYAGGGVLPSTTTQSPTKGKFNTTGGELQTLSSSMELAQGNTHGENKVDGQYGITLDNGQEQVAEIEDEEVLSDNQKVFSNRLMVNKTKSFADVAKKIGMKAGKIEKKLEKTNDSISRNGYERQLAGTKMAEDSLFQLQEITKQQEGVKELENYMAYGGLFGRKKLPIDGSQGTVSDADMTASLVKGFNAETPPATDPSLGSYVAPMLIDNIGNLLLTANTPKPQKPIMNYARKLNTKVDVTPQLSELQNAIESNTTNVLNNTANSNTARSNIASTKLRGLEQKLGILGAKENTETGLENQDAMNRQNVDAGNNQLRNGYMDTVLQRKLDMNSQLSGNLADMSKNIGEGITNKQMDKYYDEVMLLDLLDDPTGEKVSSMDKNPYFKNGNRPKLNEAIQAEVLRRKKNKRYDFRLNPNISPTIKFE
jgi:hypothetical protein